MNLFAWIRDGVKDAVLLGVSDAVGDIGTPADGERYPPAPLAGAQEQPASDCR